MIAVKLNVFVVLSFLVTILLTIIVVCFLNKFLLLVYGYRQDMIESMRPESFEAYRAIFKPKIFVVLASFLMSIILLVFARKLSVQNPRLIYFVIYGASWVILIIYLVILALFFIVPKRPLV